MAFGAALLLAVTWLAAPGEGGGQGPSASSGRVALVLSSGDGQLLTRLGAELRAQRFEVVEAAGAPVDVPPPRALEQVLRETGAAAAIRVETTPALVRVWIANATTGKQIFREVAPEDHHLDRALVALWAVELLRASGFAPARAAGVSSVDGGAPPPARLGVAVELAPALTFSPGGLGAALQLFLGARWPLGPRAGLEGLVLFPTAPARLQGVGGVALVSVAIAGVGAFVRTGGATARWSAQAAAGAAVSLVHASGDASDPTYAGGSDTVVGGGPYARLGLSVRATSWLRLRADALAGATFPRPVVVLADPRVADWGRPWTAAALGVEAVFP